MSDDIVYFNMPDGSKVSNDPRWVAEEAQSAMEAVLDDTPNRGNAGIPDEEQAAQIGGGLAPGQSGQPGVGESPAATAEELAAGQVTGRVMQHEDRMKAMDAGLDAENPLEKGVEPKDSNEAVLAAREEAAERQRKAAEAMAALGDDGPGDPDQPYSKWTAKQLKAEVLNRPHLDTKGLKGKAAVIAALEADDDTGTAGK